MDHLATLRLSIFFLFLFLMFAVETLFPKRKWEQGRIKRMGFHLSLSLFNSIIIRLTIATPMILLLLWIHENNWGLTYFLGLSGVNEFIISFVVFDIFDYWMHRLNHEIPFFWKFHRVHHADTHVDVSTSLRFHIGEFYISSCLKAIFFLVWAPSILCFVFCEIAITIFSQFHHSNIDFPDPFENFIRLIIITPRIHTSHHTVTKRTGDANYATIFSVWDRIFRTFREPNFEEMKTIGVKLWRENILSPWKLIKAPFEHIRD